MCETFSSRQFLGGQETAGISSQKVSTDCWHLTIIFSRGNWISLLPPINVFWWHRASGNNKTVRRTSLPRGWQTTLGFTSANSLKVNSFLCLEIKESWEFDNNYTNTARSEQKMIWFVISPHRRVSRWFNMQSKLNGVFHKHKKSPRVLLQERGLCAVLLKSTNT